MEPAPSTWAGSRSTSRRAGLEEWAALALVPAINCRDCAVGEFLRNRIPADSYFVAFGNERSSALAYLSQRKSLTVPPFYRSYQGIARHPELHFW